MGLFVSVSYPLRWHPVVRPSSINHSLGQDQVSISFMIDLPESCEAHLICRVLFDKKAFILITAEVVVFTFYSSHTGHCFLLLFKAFARTVPSYYRLSAFIGLLPFLVAQESTTPAQLYPASVSVPLWSEQEAQGLVPPVNTSAWGQPPTPRGTPPFSACLPLPPLPANSLLLTDWPSLTGKKKKKKKHIRGKEMKRSKGVMS